jgi:hypothetical protein
VGQGDWAFRTLDGHWMKFQMTARFLDRTVLK